MDSRDQTDQINEIDEIDEIDETDQIDQTDETDEIDQIDVGINLCRRLRQLPNMQDLFTAHWSNIRLRKGQ